MMLFFEYHLLNLHFTVHIGDFKAHVGTDTDTWNGVVGKREVTGLNKNGRYFCSSVVATDSAL